ncbi:UNVERIFIED_CONTAM: kinase-regulated stress-responsive transcription factor skn7 [Siphonaria sp. JEL0065]|nr:kinase-regulated stress-responsive transcription factor skn7 [Siphonaria sp. JEL0065]
MCELKERDVFQRTNRLVASGATADKVYSFVSWKQPYESEPTAPRNMTSPRSLPAASESPSSVSYGQSSYTPAIATTTTNTASTGRTTSSAYLNSLSRDDDDDASDFEEPDEPQTAGTGRKRKRAAVSDFISKLYQAIQQSSYPEHVRWSDAGDSFIVYDSNEFAKCVLPILFKHKNFQSFVRQLNKYDFHKVKVTDLSSQLYGETSSEFKHPSFLRGQPDLLKDIIRKKVPIKRLDRTESMDVAPKFEDFNGTPSKVDVDASILARLEQYNRQSNAVIANLEAKVNDLTSIQQQAQKQLSKVNEDYYVLQNEMKHLKTIVSWQDQMMQEFTKLEVGGFAHQQKLQMLQMFRANPPPGMQQLQHSMNSMNSMQASSRGLYRKSLSTHSNTSPMLQPANPQITNLTVNNMHAASMSPQLPLPMIPQYGTPNGGSSSSEGGNSPFSNIEELNTDVNLILNYLASGTEYLPQSRNSPTLLHHQQQTIQQSMVVPAYKQKHLPNPKYLALVIEEQSIYRQIIGTHFTMFNISCDFISSWQEFNELYGDPQTALKNYHVVLVDVHMQQLNGLQTVAQLRSKIAGVRVIALSGVPMVGLEMQQYYQAGIAQILLKPFSPKGLKDILKIVGLDV